MLLAEPAGSGEAPRLDPAWFVNECPLDPDAAVEAIRRRHGFAGPGDALRALRRARDQLRATKHPDATTLDEL